MPRKKKIEEQETAIEPKEELKVEEVQPEQPKIEEKVEVSGKTKITKENYLEFYDMQLKGPSTFRSTIFMCLIMCLYLYLFRGESTPLEVLIRCLICCGIILVITLIFNLISRYVAAPKNYEKSGFDKLEIEFEFSNIGIRQSIYENGEKQSGIIYWTQIMRAIETPNSFFFLSQRNGLICSKANFSEEERAKISEMLLEYLGPTKYKKSKELEKKKG